MLKSLIRNTIGQKFFGSVARWARDGDLIEYIIRESDGKDCYVYVHKPLSEQKEGDEGPVGVWKYVEVTYPGFFRKPTLTEVPAYIELEPKFIGRTSVPNLNSPIVPVACSVSRVDNLLPQTIKK